MTAPSARALAAAALLAAPLAALLAPPRTAAAQPAAQVVASMSTVRSVHSAVPLLDGRIFVVGGHGDAGNRAEIYDPATGEWTPTPDSAHYHDWPVVARLCDGRVYVGGRISLDERQAEIYDPAANAWTSAGSMIRAHIYGTATLLADCRVLLVGGYGSNTQGETYTPETGTYKSVIGFMTNERFFHTTTALPDGRALVASGGINSNGTWYDHPSADIYDPITNKWIKVANLKYRRRSHSATLLPDGRVLVAGGTYGGKNDGTDGGTQRDTAEIYDPVTNTWGLLEARLVTARSFHTVAVLPNGAIALIGGLDASGSASRQVEVFFEGTFHPLPPLLVDRFQHASAQLPDGRVLVTGGVHQATAELYSLAQLGEPCSSAVACASGFCAGGLCCTEACDTGCRRCDLPGSEGTCTPACADDAHALVCPDGSATCPNDACVPTSCSPYRCGGEPPACHPACTSVADCADGYACDPDGKCVPPPDVAASDAEACSASAQPAAGASLGALAAGVAAAALLRRRRRGGRSPVGRA